MGTRQHAVASAVMRQRGIEAQRVLEHHFPGVAVDDDGGQALGAGIEAEVQRHLVNLDQSQATHGLGRPANLTRTPPVTSRGEPMVVGSVPTKYSSSPMFCTPKNASKLRPIGRDAVNDATV